MGRKTTAMIKSIFEAEKKRDTLRDELLKIKADLERARKDFKDVDTAYQKYYTKQGYGSNFPGREERMDADKMLQSLNLLYDKKQKMVTELEGANRTTFKDWEAQRKVRDKLVDELDKFIANKAKDRKLPWASSSMRRAKEVIALMRA